MPRKTTNFIAVHCSATKPDYDIGAKTIRNWHKKRGWSDIGYNFVIRRNGKIENGRDLDGDGDSFEEIGAHVRGYNSKSVGICLVGGVDYDGRPDANFTFEQYQALKSLLDKFDKQLKGNAIIQGHRDFPNVNKACPCFNVHEFYYGASEDK